MMGKFEIPGQPAGLGSGVWCAAFVRVCAPPGDASFEILGLPAGLGRWAVAISRVCAPPPGVASFEIPGLPAGLGRWAAAFARVCAPLWGCEL
uniref:Uncharacterized protein n=1 Tax=Picea sitchensis TaxID=3332 RepID=B8LRF2_PICSI|nr:unknown [Picea sitchensis]